MSSLPTPSFEERTPSRDLRNQVRKARQYSFDTGGFSDIYKGEWTRPETGEIVPVAIKVLRGVHTDGNVLQTVTRRLNRESWLWSTLEHPNILPFYGVCSDVEPFTGIVSPYCENGTIDRYIASHPDVDKLYLLRGIGVGVAYLHDRNMVHGDLKSNNVLIDDSGVPKLCDFGRAKLLGHKGFTTTLSASIRYLAPEIMSQDNPEDDELAIPSLTKESDVYAFGMVVLETLTGKMPFYYFRNETFVLQRVLNNQRPLRERYEVPVTDGIWNLINKCWAADPSRRPSIQNAVERLEDM